MKKLIITVALAAVSLSSFAQDSSGSVALAGPVAAGTAVRTDTTSTAAATNQGNAQSITFTSPSTTTSNVNSTVAGTTTSNVNQALSGTTTSNVNSNISGTQTQNVNYGTQTIKNTPSVSGPNLTSSNDTCMGSASGSANVPGIGLSFGKTYTDDNCVMLKNSRELWNMGMKAASMALMCMDKNNRAALEMTGFVCPQSEQRRTASVNVTPREMALQRNEPVDPIVRSRMGLPAIKE